MTKTLKEHFREISALRKQYRDWLHTRIECLADTTPRVALPLETSNSVLAAIDSLSDDLSYRTVMLAERQEKRQIEIDLLNANITALRVTVSDITHKTMQIKSVEARLKKIDEREKKIQSIQENLERFVETKSEQIKKQEEKRQQNAEKNLPAVS
jgi:DNA repair exonuclease SbcCD ATPase subunit